MTDAIDHHECIYLDTNILVSLLIGDGLALRAEEWFTQQSSAFAISEWTRAEVHGVIGLRKRKGELTTTEARAALAEFTARAGQHLQTMPVNNEAAALAAEWLRNPDCTLQTGDALHLAVAHAGGATILATFDERFAKAAQKLKLARLKIELIGEKVRRVEQRRAAYVVGNRVASDAARPKSLAMAATKKKTKR
jgi:predicted nucleic acid-binding protein